MRGDYAWLSWHGNDLTGCPATREGLDDLKQEMSLWVSRSNGGRWYLDWCNTRLQGLYLNHEEHLDWHRRVEHGWVHRVRGD